jgi:hypothetical protein
VAGGRTGAGEALSFFFDGAGDELRLGAMLVGKTPGPDPFLKKARGRLDRSLLWNRKNSRIASAAKIISANIGFHLKRARETRFLQNAFIL